MPQAKKKGLTGDRSALCAEGRLLVSGSRLLVTCMVGGAARAGLWPHAVLVHLGCTLHIVVEVGASRNQIVLFLLASLAASPNLDTGGIDALLLNQVVLGVDGALRSQLRTLFLVCCRVANHNSSRIRLTLQVEGYVIQAGLGFVVDAARTALVTIEVDRAERLRLGLRRRWRLLDVDAGRSRSRLALVICHVAGHGNATGRRASCVEGRGVVAAVDLASRGRVGVGQRAILRAYALCSDRRAITRLQGGGIGRAADGRRLKLLDLEVRGAIGELSGLLTLRDMSRNGVAARVQTVRVDGPRGAVAGDLNAVIPRPRISSILLGVEVGRGAGH